MVAPEKRDAAADVAALQQIGELFHDEAGEAVAARGLLGLVEEAGEVFADYPVQNGVFGFSRRVADAGHRAVVAAGEGVGGSGSRTGPNGMAAGGSDAGGNGCGLPVVGCRSWERLIKAAP